MTNLGGLLLLSPGWLIERFLSDQPTEPISDGRALHRIIGFHTI